jgi:hypothetical protein
MVTTEKYDQSAKWNPYRVLSGGSAVGSSNEIAQITGEPASRLAFMRISRITGYPAIYRRRPPLVAARSGGFIPGVNDVRRRFISSVVFIA